jgi:hypothetical protein
LLNALSFSDAAEMDAMDEWMQTMIDLSILEDREEMARNFVLLKKRFETRVCTIRHISSYDRIDVY